MGRPKGSPNKITAEVKAAAAKHYPEALKTLAAIMRDAEQPPQARVSAAKELLDRAAGKAPQALTDAEGGALNLIAKVIHEHRGA